MMRTAQHETSERVRVVSGSVGSDGAHKNGVGFVVRRISTGVYTINWAFPVKQVRNIVLTLHTGIAFTYVVTNWGPSGFTVAIWNSAVTVVLDSEFGFIATVIPR